MSRDLFGFEAREAPPEGRASVALVLHDQTEKAWLLGESLDIREAQWAPKSQAKRGDGRDENVWTMPTWLARDRGWV